MEFIPTDIPDVILVKPNILGDRRGFFMETWQKRVFADAGIDAGFVQDNHSRSGAGILRGLHYQLRQPQGKLVCVVRGRVFDVAVDLRRGSEHFGRWVGQELSDTNHHQLWIPPGFAHGFYVIQGPADLQYKCTDYYAPEWERCLRWDDPEVSIDWPLESGDRLVVSDKDAVGLLLSEAEVYE